jgi:hypothetical protein
MQILKVLRGASVSRACGRLKALGLTLHHAGLSFVTGGEIAGAFKRLDLVMLGKCEMIEEVMIGENTVSLVGIPLDLVF